MWSLQCLHRLLVDQSGKSMLNLQSFKNPDSSLNNLLLELPHALLKQYEYEDVSVRAGLHLMHSDFFKVLVALACDLELDNVIGVADNHKWSWFRRYCHSARVAKSLINRTPLPKNFCQEVRKKLLNTTEDDNTDIVYDYESHVIFKKEHDEQLLAWLNRFVLFFLTSVLKLFDFILGNQKIGRYRGAARELFIVGDTTIVDNWAVSKELKLNYQPLAMLSRV